tara:strand:- start:1154 stop:2035 length:882 start_codon:yes stop_codon:yes gene_type:complete
MVRVLVIGSSGYIGSRLCHELVNLNYIVSGCDISKPDFNQENITFIHKNYKDLSISELEKYKCIFWFAGHSTVSKSIDDPFGSFTNNVSDLLDLSKKLDDLKIKMIYASSASLYSSSNNAFSLIANEERSNPYDSSKLSFDMVVNTLKYNVLGLRMGTVAGWAPKIRMETLFNSLNYNAYHNALINITNASNFRAILYIDDLMHFLINELDINLTQETTSQLPLSSWSGSIGTLGCEVANFWHVPIHFGKDDGTYSFVATDKYLKSNIEQSLFYKPTSERCNQFASMMNWKKK